MIKFIKALLLILSLLWMFSTGAILLKSVIMAVDYCIRYEQPKNEGELTLCAIKETPYMIKLTIQRLLD